MGTPRILGNNAEIFVNLGAGVVSVGEVDKFSAKSLSEIKKSQALGQKTVTSNVVHMGWDLSFEGGKIDWKTAQAFHAQDEQIVKGGRAPLFTVKQKITYYNGQVEEFEYTDVSLAGYELDMGGATEEMSEKFVGFAAARRASNTDANIVATKTGITSHIATILAALGAQVR